MRLTFANVVAILALVAALAGGALAAPKLVGSDGQIHACATKKGRLKVVKQGKKCGKKKTALAWSRSGPRGGPGPTGGQGDPGDQGKSNLQTKSFNRTLDDGSASVTVATSGDIELKASCSGGKVLYRASILGFEISFSGREWVDDSAVPVDGTDSEYATASAAKDLQVDTIVSQQGDSNWTHLLLGAHRSTSTSPCAVWGELEQ
jgi:hypothetical protein